MVKNTTGGKHKNQARKLLNSTNSRVPLSQDENECYALNTKMSGNGMCRVDVAYKNTILKDVCCHIRGKFRHKNKKHNFVNVNSILLVGLREWASDKKQCDLLFVYSDHDINSLPTLPFNQNTNSVQPHDDLFDFNANANTHVDTHIIPNTIVAPIMENTNAETIDFDDI
jgi:translation initiation factor IF-1